MSDRFKHRILVVDSDQAALSNTVALLSREGYEVLAARDGFEALAALRGGAPDVLISDLTMPNMSGFELLAVVRKRFPGIGVIVTSGDFTPANVPEGVLADRFLEKYRDSGSKLAEAVRELLKVCPVRSQPPRPDSAPAWLPISTTGYIVLTCPSCLRSFSLPTKGLEFGVVLRDSCLHCNAEVRYRIDRTVAAAQPQSDAERTMSRVRSSRGIIETSAKAIRRSKERVAKNQEDGPKR